MSEGMYQKAISFLEDRVKKHGGELDISFLYELDNVEGELMRAALGHLLPTCDATRTDYFIDGLSTRGVINEMNGVPGWDVHVLNKEMLDMLKADCANMAEQIETDSFYRWQEEHKQLMSGLSEWVMSSSYAFMLYYNSVAGTTYRQRENAKLEKTGNDLNKTRDRTVSGQKETGGGRSKEEILNQNRKNGRAFEQQEFKKFSSKYNEAKEQITIKTSSGVKTRVDAIGLDSKGNVVISEFKSSATAPLTSNQKVAFPEIEASGATVVGRGKGIFTGGYSIPAGTKVVIVRPG